MDAGRLLISEPALGDWNMAVDESLMTSAADSGLITLRCYRWKEPTLSLGYFQSARERESHPPSQSCRWVRRHSGGGAILHHYDVTYSLTMPAAFRPPRHAVHAKPTGTAEWVYRVVHDVAIETLKSMEISAQRFGESLEHARSDAASHPHKRDPDQPDSEAPLSSRQPFLCFQRRTADDLVVGPGKVLGSAQRRRAGALLQHGSILWAKSDFAPELPGIAELSNRSEGSRRWLDWTMEFIDKFSPQLFETLGVDFRRDDLTELEAAQAESIRVDKYGNEAWNWRR